MSSLDISVNNIKNSNYNKHKCEDCKYQKHFCKKEFPCIDCDLRYHDRFEWKK